LTPYKSQIIRKITLLLLFAFMTITLTAQNADELKKELASKKDSISKLQAKAKKIQSQIDKLPG